MSPENEPMKLFRATYKDERGSEYRLDLYARSISQATLSASELMPPGAKLTNVFFNPDW